MTIENTKATREIKEVLATMAIENMYFSKDFVEELVKVANGEKSSEQLRQEVLSKFPNEYCCGSMSGEYESGD